MLSGVQTFMRATRRNTSAWGRRVRLFPSREEQPNAKHAGGASGARVSMFI
jgi:hypothetical protein